MCRLPTSLPLRLLLLGIFSQAVFCQTLPSFDFTQAADRQGWIAANHISQLGGSTEGLVLTISGPDPYLTGPARTYPANQPLWLRLKIKSDQSGSCQLFYYTSAPTEAASVRFDVPAGRWVEGKVAIPSLGSNYRIRIDPPGTGGTAVLGALRLEARGSLPDFDFRTVPDALEWGSPHDMQIQPVTLEGLPLKITGSDPYFFGPARNFPAGQLLWINLRIRSDASGMAQLFYFQTGPSEEKSVRFYVPGGDWADVRVPIPSLGNSTRLRLDPPGASGTCLLGRMSFEIRPVIQDPAWSQPVAPSVSSNAKTISTGDLTLLHSAEALGAFELRVNHESVAIGNSRPMLGYTAGNSVRWMTLSTAPTLSQDGNSLRVRTEFSDPDSGSWTLEQLFSPSGRAGGIEVETRLTPAQERSVVFFPMLTLFPGVGSFGTNKTQGLLAGVEYLENEPSSSEADVIGPGSRRQVPDSLKLTFPLMALSTSNRYVGVLWEAQSHFAALHDSPDRIFNSGGHVLSVIYPGSDPNLREDGRVLPYMGQAIKAGETITLKATILGGKGSTVIPAVKEYVARRGLPSLPNTGYTPQQFFTLTARGWLDSQIRDGAKFRHAVGGSFGSQAVADAPFYMDWLALNVGDAVLSNRLATLAREALALVQPANYNSAAVGHIRYPAESLVYGSVPDNLSSALAEGTGQLSVFEPDGSVIYRAPSTGNDLARTHWSREANGLTGVHVMTVLERAVLTGDRNLISQGLRLLRALSKYRDTVPRGAQTWEVPLHTPDILASAWLVRAYQLGYELTGEADFLEQAIYWAWTGVPFVYLTPPNPNPVGVYSTIPVLGATQFVAPLWIGLPVQWCGLVYGDAIRRLARHDHSGPWVQIADGIAAAGVQHTHTAAEPQYQGLLPDSFDLRSQVRNPVPINPATLLPEALQFFGKPPVYDRRAFMHHGLFVHAPGLISEARENNDRVSFRANGWPARPWRLLITGLKKRPRVFINGMELQITAPHLYQEVEGRLILYLTRPAIIELDVAAKDALKIQKSGASQAIRLSWPLSDRNSTLESTPLLGDGEGWSPTQSSFLTEGEEQAFYLVPSKNAEFFRLKVQ